MTDAQHVRWWVLSQKKALTRAEKAEFERLESLLYKQEILSKKAEDQRLKEDFPTSPPEKDSEADDDSDFESHW